MSGKSLFAVFAGLAVVLFLLFRKHTGGWAESSYSVPAYIDWLGNVNYVPQTIEVQAGADPVQTIDAQTPWVLS